MTSNTQIPLVAVLAGVKPLARFWNKVERPSQNECWLWTGSKNYWGYGTFWGGEKVVKAHRFAFTQCVGAIPDGMLVCHSCDRPLCCNPAHLWLGTDLSNCRDKEKKGRGNHPVGDRNWMRKNPEKVPRGVDSAAAKLTEAQVLEIRRLAPTRMYTKKQIGAMFGVTEFNITAIVGRKTWRHLP